MEKARLSFIFWLVLVSLLSVLADALPSIIVTAPIAWSELQREVEWELGELDAKVFDYRYSGNPGEGALRTISNSQSKYLEKYGVYGTLDELYAADLISFRYKRGRYGCYVVDIWVDPEQAEYVWVARAYALRNHPGYARTFFTDHTGRIMGFYPGESPTDMKYLAREKVDLTQHPEIAKRLEIPSSRTAHERELTGNGRK